MKKTVFWTFLIALMMFPFSISPVAAQDYAIDTAHSSVVFSAFRQGVVNVYGRFNEMDGKLVFDESNPEAGSFSLTIKTESVDTNNERRDNHLRSPDFFNSAQFPEMVFKSTSVKRIADNRYEVTGDLSLHGVTRPISAEVVHTGSAVNERRGTRSVGFETRFTITRSQFDMNFMQGPLSDDIEVILAIHGVQRSEAR